MLTMRYMKKLIFSRGRIDCKPYSDGYPLERPGYSKPKKEEEDEGFIKKGEFSL